jgi:hypothetical protein
MTAKTFFIVIPFKGNPERRITLIKKKGIKPKGGSITVFNKIWFSKGGNKIHVPTDLLTHVDYNASYLLITIAAAGIKGKLNENNPSYTLQLSQLLIEPKHIKKIEVFKKSEKQEDANFNTKLRMSLKR